MHGESDEIDASPRTDRPAPPPRENQGVRLQRLVDRVTLRPQWPLWTRLYVEHVENEDALRVVVRIDTKDIRCADDDVNIYMMEQLEHAYLIAMSDDYLTHGICKLIQRAVLHELDECLLVDGKQVRDPHVVNGVARL